MKTLTREQQEFIEEQERIAEWYQYHYNAFFGNDLERNGFISNFYGLDDLRSRAMNKLNEAVADIFGIDIDDEWPQEALDVYQENCY